MKKRITAVILSMALVLSIGGLVFGVSSYLSQFNTKYGTSGTALNTCNLCHPTGGYTLNPYASDFANNNHDFAAIEALDSDGDGYSNLAEIKAGTFPGDPASHPVADATPPVVTAFTIPTAAGSLMVAVNTFTATDNVAVTGYLITETALKPAATAAGWSATVPTSYTFTSAGAKTLYAWAKDAAGNVSTGVMSAKVTITLTDTTPPTVTAFTIPGTSASLVVTVNAFTATDNTGVTGYLITETSAVPAATAAGWSATAPASYTFTSAGAKTLYAWAKDAAGNVSTGVMSAKVTITLTDTTPPTVTAFTVPATTLTLNVPVTAFSATDNVGVTGYLITETSAKPALTDTGWSATPPTSYTSAIAGAKTLYAWAKDAAGNVSTAATATVTAGLGDTSAPVITNFILPPDGPTLKIPILNLTASDNIAVTGYIITESAVPPNPAAAGWSDTPPASYTFKTQGVKALYAWAKDAAGNVSIPWSDMVTVIITDFTPPEVMEFTVDGASDSLIVPIRQFSAIDDLEVTGYMVTTSAVRPKANDPRWKATPPTSFTFPPNWRGATRTLYGWAKDAAGNVSDGLADGVALNIDDTVFPTVTAFEVPATAAGRTVSVPLFTATDNKVVAGYMITNAPVRPAWTSPNWSATPPATFTFGAPGVKRLFPWVRDGSGNVSRLYTATKAKIVVTGP